MRRPGRHTRTPGPGARRGSGRVRGIAVPLTSLTSIVALLVIAIIMASPAGTAADSAQNLMAPSVPLTGKSVVEGPPAVGALFVTTSSGLASHFCTASVVHSPNRDLVITAAHCLTSLSVDLRKVTFVPGYHDREAPYGVWTLAHLVVDHAWVSSADPDDDVAFLVVTREHGSARIEDVTGAEQLATGQPPTGVVQVIGYPNTQELPVACQNRTTAISATQQQFDCDGFTDGTSGGPFLAAVSPTTGNGLVVGVVGGYQEGGYSPEISYSPTFRSNVAALYKSAVALG